MDSPLFAAGVACAVGVSAAEALASSSSDVASWLILGIVVLAGAMLLARFTWGVIHSPGHVLDTRWYTPSSLVALAVLTVGIGLSVSMSGYSEAQVRATTEKRFETIASEANRVLYEWVYRPIYGMHGARGVFAASDEVTPEDFADYVASRDLPVEFPGVSMMGFAAIDETGRWMLTRAQPGDAGGVLRGLDLSSFASAGAALEDAVAAGEARLADLSGDDGAGAAFGGAHPMLWIVPVYRRGEPMQTVDDRAASIQGSLVSTFFAEGLKPKVSEALKDSAAMRVSLHRPEGGGVNLFDAGGRASDDPAISTASTITIGGTQFRVELASTPVFEAKIDTLSPVIIQSIGLALSVIVAWALLASATARQRAEELARAMTVDLRRLSIIAENTGNVVVMTDASGRATWVNRAFTEVTGYTPEDVLGKVPGRLLQCDQTDPNTRAAMRAAIDAGVAFRCEVLNRSKDGHEYWLDIDSQPIRDERGDVTGFFAIETDLTERKAFEAEITAAKVEAETANAAKSRFLSAMSHEIRTPLNGIIGFADLLRRNADEGDEAVKSEWIEIIHASGQHLLSLLNDVLDLSKMDAGAIEIATVPTSPIETISGAILLLKSRADDKGIDLDFRIEGNVPPAVRSDPTRLRQIVMNLVSNAVKFTEAGGVTVTLDAPERDGESVLRLVVADTGIGMSAEQVDRVFEPFKQADASVAERFGGTGLGLSISRDLARRLGGDITVASAIGVGSTFTFECPATPLLGDETLPGASLGPASIDDESARSALAGVRVLVADDVEANRTVAELFLRRAGADVTLAEDGQAAVERASSERFDVMLLDIQMPRLSGLEAAEALRARGETAPILALTAFSSGAERSDCIRAGMDDFLSKPFEPEVLIRTIARYAQDAAANESFALDVSDDPELAKVAENWLAKLPERLALIESNLNAGDAEAVARHAHAIKGSAPMLGFAKIGHDAQRLERAAIADDLDEARLMLTSIWAGHRARSGGVAA